MSDPAHDKLRDLASKFTQPGPWRIVALKTGFSILDRHDMWLADLGKSPIGDARYIAAMSPDVVLALLDRIDALEANAVRMREYRFSLENIPTDGKGNPL